MDTKYMEYAIELAEKGSGFVNPNPLVGAVIVKDDRIIGEGYHKKIGGPHAEINAFENAKEDVEGATLYVTLEPCSHYGKTPPCVEAIIEKKISRVVIGMGDPNPLVAGRGIARLRDNGIKIETGILEDECRAQNEIFVKYISTKKPFCILKSAMTLDGKIAGFSGDSKWISSEESRLVGHAIRQRVSAIMVGVGTVISDDPMLTTRLNEIETKNSIRIIVDSKARIPLDSSITRTARDIRTILATTRQASIERLEVLKTYGVEILMVQDKEDKVDIYSLVDNLGEMGIDSILIEGGGELSYSALLAEVVDKVVYFIAPKIIGGRDSKTPVEGDGIQKMRDAIKIERVKISTIGKDILLEGYPERR